MQSPQSLCAEPGDCDANGGSYCPPKNRECQHVARICCLKGDAARSAFQVENAVERAPQFLTRNNFSNGCLHSLEPAMNLAQIQ